MSDPALAAAQLDFTAALQAVDDAVRFALRKSLKPQDYEDALAEARAAAWSAWHGLITRGKDPRAVGVHGIATNAVRHVKNGRKLGNPTRGRGARDVQHPKVRRALGLRVLPFDEVLGPPGGSWRDWLAEDHRSRPADEAAFRIDFAAWLDRLPARQRRIAELLAQGHEGLVVARTLGLSPARISQLRPALEASWHQFQGQLRDDLPAPRA